APLLSQADAALEQLEQLSRRGDDSALIFGISLSSALSQVMQNLGFLDQYQFWGHTLPWGPPEKDPISFASMVFPALFPLVQMLAHQLGPVLLHLRQQGMGAKQQASAGSATQQGAPPATRGPWGGWDVAGEREGATGVWDPAADEVFAGYDEKEEGLGFVGGDYDAGGRAAQEVSPKPEPLIPKPETRNPKPETRNPKPETRNPKPEILNPKPEPLNLKPETLNPKP
ncbi:hypothetical protein T484DRAFT_3647568, partial [Baffinella frigidus]